MFGMAARYFDMKSKMAKAETKTVSEPEFIRLCQEDGMTLDEAKQLATNCKALGSETMVGGVMLGIEDQPK